MFEINHLLFAYDDNIVFDDFSFSTQKGEILGIVGNNGSGKTTLLKVLCGLNYCPALKCRINGTPISQNELKQYVTYIPATPELHDSLTMKEYILWVKALWKRDDTFLENTDKYMSVLDFHVRADTEISAYSLGMKYKLFFCVFLALDNPILLLDEPLNSLDISSREKAISLIKQYVYEKNCYCLFSSHVKETLNSLATKIISI